MSDEWRDAFVLRARLRDVPGPRIGEALAEVETHCAESGETPAEAFGDPVRYAQALADQLPPPARNPRLGWARVALAGAAGIGAVSLLLSGVAAVSHDEPATISTGTFGSVLVGVGFVVGFFAVAERASARGLRWLLPPLIALGLVLTALPTILLRDSGFTSSGWVAIAAAGILFAVAWLALGRTTGADRIVDPRTGAEPTLAPKWVLAVARYGPAAMLLAAVALVILLPPGDGA